MADALPRETTRRVEALTETLRRWDWLPQDWDLPRQTCPTCGHTKGNPTDYTEGVRDEIAALVRVVLDGKAPEDSDA